MSSGPLVSALLLFACTTGQEADIGTDAWLEVNGAAFFRGSLPPEQNGPLVEAAYLTQTRFPVGIQQKSFSGVLGATATALTIALEGDQGYWVVPAEPPLTETPELPSFSAPLSFSLDVSAGSHALLLSAVNGQGRFGPRLRVPFTLTPRALPTGPLVFSLFWDRPSDLDLHVVLPDGIEVYKDETNSWEPSLGTSSVGPNSGGQLDLDSNAQCRPDGRNNENISWKLQPPSGRYVARVDTFSLCGETAARWDLEVRRDRLLVAAASGTSLETDTRNSHGRGAGVTALELWVE